MKTSHVIAIVLAILMGFLGLAGVLAYYLFPQTAAVLMEESGAAPSQSMVYLTPNGGLYHVMRCSRVDPTAKRWPISQALNAGYKPCDECQPPAGAPTGQRTAATFDAGRVEMVETTTKGPDGTETHEVRYVIDHQDAKVYDTQPSEPANLEPTPLELPGYEQPAYGAPTTEGEVLPAAPQQHQVPYDEDAPYKRRKGRSYQYIPPVASPETTRASWE